MFVWFIEGKPRTYSPEKILRGAVSSTSAITPAAKVSAEGLDKPAAASIQNPYSRLDKQAPRRERAVTIRQIMSSPVITLVSNSTLLEAWSLFKQHRFRHVPVLSGAGQLVGILSDRDVLRFFAEDAERGSKTMHVRDMMVQSVLTANPDTSIRDAARVMFQERIGSMPVVEANGNMLGIVTRSDILRTVMNNVPLELWT